MYTMDMPSNSALDYANPIALKLTTQDLKEVDQFALQERESRQVALRRLIRIALAKVNRDQRRAGR